MTTSDTRTARSGDRGVLRDPVATGSLVLLVGAPLAVLPAAYDPFGLPVLLVAVVGAVAAWALPATARLPRWLLVGTAVMAALLVVSALAGDTPVPSLVGRWPRYEGLPLLMVLLAVAGASARLARVPVRTVAAVVSVVLLGLTLLDVAGVGPVPGAGVGRVESVVGNATDLGAVATALALVLAPGLLAAGRERALAAAGTAAAVLVVVLSGSRTSLVLTAVGVVALLLLRGRGRRTWGVAGGLVLATGAATLVVPATRERLLITSTGSGRVEQWRLTLDLVRDHPWLGVGPSRYVDAFAAYESPAFVDFTGVGTVADSPHSVPLQIAVAGGLPLLVAGLVVAALAVRALVTVARRREEVAGPAAATLALGAVLLVNPTSLPVLVAGAVWAGRALAVPSTALGWSEPSERPTASEPSRRPLDLLVATGLAVVATALVAALVGDVRLADSVDAAERGRVAVATVRADDAARWRPWDTDVARLAAPPLAEEAAGTAPSPTGLTAARAAERLARDGLTTAPDDPRTLVVLGVALLAQDRPDEALPVLDRAVALSPERPDGYVQRAVAHASTGDLAGARADLRRAVGIDPRSAARRLLRLLGDPPG
ncbi:MAG: hypothetical protein CMH83_04340 [Nocardioides sp.]|nr:hypothetical protein [Nocardioides sp.]